MTFTVTAWVEISRKVPNWNAPKLNIISVFLIIVLGKKAANPFPGWENQDWSCLLASKVKNKDSWLGKRISDTTPGWEEHFLIFVWLALRSGYYFPTKVNYQPNSTQWLLENRFGRKRSNFGNFLVEYSCLLLRLDSQLPAKVHTKANSNFISHYG